MFRLIVSSVKILVQWVVIVVVIFAIAIGIFTFNYPDSAVSYIQSYLVKEKEPSLGDLIGLGIIGDSQSDEYRADDNRGSNFPSSTLNWVEILEQERGVNMGKWSYWEEPRRQGYEFNWARSGATAESMIASGQHVGLAEQVKNGEVNVVVIYIGANDFAPYQKENGYGAIYNGVLTDAQLELKENLIVAHIQTAINVIRSDGEVQLFLVSIPDWGKHVGVKFAFPIPQKRILVTQSINNTNMKLRKLATERNAIFIDSNTFYSDLPKNTSTGKIVIGDTELEVLQLNNSPENVFLRDGVHTGTAFNGLFANYMLAHINSYLTEEIVPLSNEEILEISGIR